jgi:hypothetical protein
MPVNRELYNSVATKGEVSGVAIISLIAIRALREAIEKLAAKAHVDVAEELASVDQQLIDLNKRFDQLVGWTE